MDYQVWEGYMPGSGYAFAEEAEGLSLEQQNAAMAGQPLPDNLPPLVVTRLSPGKLPDVLETIWGLRLVAPNIREVIEGFDPGLAKFIPVKVAPHPRKKYFLANFLHKLDLFDRKKSDWTAYEDDKNFLRSVTKLVLKPVPDDAPALFLLEELVGVVLVRDDLREQIQAASASPGHFTPVDKFKYGIVL